MRPVRPVRPVQASGPGSQDGLSTNLTILRLLHPLCGTHPPTYLGWCSKNGWLVSRSGEVRSHSRFCTLLTMLLKEKKKDMLINTIQWVGPFCYLGNKDCPLPGRCWTDLYFFFSFFARNTSRPWPKKKKKFPCQGRSSNRKKTHKQNYFPSLHT